MMKRNTLYQILSAIIAALGIGLIIMTRPAALAADATDLSKMLFSISLILAIVGIVWLIVTVLPQRKKVSTQTLSIAALFAALCYISFTFCKIDIPVGMEKTAFHLGNVFCVLAALFLGGFWGGMAGAIGMTIADLTTAYVTSAPKTFLLKLGIGLITGAIAHGIFKLSHNKNRKLPLPIATAISCIGGMAFNVVADPVVGYFYKIYVLGVPQDAAKIWAKIGAVTTLVNALVAVVAASILYLATRTALQKAKLLPKL